MASAEEHRKAYIDDVSEESSDHTYQTHAVGPYWLTFASLPLLENWKQSPGGSRFAAQIMMATSMNA
ncbi:hypothetical protein BD413DRAFT_247582 [Trametes elegans]|nr:hypothetical protein BD413DRAFT_247582 [Trametes elegans]